MKHYTKSVTKTKAGTFVVLKDSAYRDPDVFRECKKMASEINASVVTSPQIGFLLSNSKDKKTVANTRLMFLHASDIEDGGPQPRLEIRPDDPETVNLFNSIKEKGQLVPINAFPSPITPKKYRISEGHRRRMVIFNMLQMDGIWAIIKDQNEQEAFEDAFTINYQRKSLTDYEMGRYLNLMLEKYQDIYPNQTALGSKLGISQSYVSYLISAYGEVERQRKKNIMTPVIMGKVEKAPEGVVRQIKKAPEDLKPALYEQVVEKNLSVEQTGKLIEEVTTEPEPDASTVAEKAQALMDDASKIQRKSDRLLDKLIAECRVKLPEVFVKHLYGLVPDGKITVEKAEAFASDWIGVAYLKLKELGKLDEVFEEASKW